MTLPTSYDCARALIHHHHQPLTLGFLWRNSSSILTARFSQSRSGFCFPVNRKADFTAFSLTATQLLCSSTRSPVYHEELFLLYHLVLFYSPLSVPSWCSCTVHSLWFLSKLLFSKFWALCAGGAKSLALAHCPTNCLSLRPYVLCILWTSTRT